jgi:phosphate uptake regulator
MGQGVTQRLGYLEKSIVEKSSVLENIVRSTARHAIHLQLDISAYALELRAVQTQKCIV